MPNVKSWILTDAGAGLWLDSFAVSSANFPHIQFALPYDKWARRWSIGKRTLRGGLRDGVDLVEVDNGAFAFSVLPTRGMGLWRGEYRGLPLGWRAPVRGPVHPKFVNLMDRGGLGWLAGFDEWIVRCGLHSNGPPGHDPPPGGEFLPLHGRVANLPAHHVEVRVDLEPPHALTLIAAVDEATLFFPNLRLISTVQTFPGVNFVEIWDVIENRGSKPAELELLYHCQFGPPFLGEGSRVRAPIRAVMPRNARAAEGIGHYDVYAGPESGYVEQVYFYDLLTDAREHTLAMLHDARQEKGVVLRFSKRELPRFIVWKNTGAEADGYVTGLEPATNLPNFKSFERDHGRVITLQPGERRLASMIVEVHDTAAGVEGVLKEIASLQGDAGPLIHPEPLPEYCQP